MERNVLIGGYGGQGVQTLGQLLGHGANEEGGYVTFHAEYGGEMRGGTSNCTVTRSDRPIGAPNKKMCDFIVAMNIPSFDRFEANVKPGGLFIYNTSIVQDAQPKRSDIETVGVPFNEIAENEVGSIKTLNIVALAFFCEYTHFVAPDVMKDVVIERMGGKKEYLELNKKAFDIGVAKAKEIKN